ncbi:MAG TPA: 2-oxoglutarate dehydrogenase, E2 component, dihydrolipoamide succinyltransferase [Terriglobales bacterium]|jgi:pyruvate dehydrogenase E2 component (dihydrolipoamide acetyltransferase)|nr:2-oxoglutarate dehydrogenase, E2 component, dihydrolipoamide succinyltransferase [Terriglobales bacterium]
MPTDVIMPQMGESIFEGTLTKWLKKPGDKVQRDEPLFEISTDKVDAEIPAPASGILKEVKVAEGATVQVNTVVGVIDAEGSAVVAAPAPAASKPAPAPTPKAEAPKPATASAPAAAPAAPAAIQAPAASTPGTNVVMPQMGESIVEGTLTKWLKKVGDKVQRDEPLFEISTDKVDAEIPAPAVGILTEIKVQPGTTVQVNTVVGVIGSTGAAAAPAPAATPASQAAKPRAAEPAAKQPAVAAVAQQPSQVLSFPAVDRDQEGRRIRSSPLVRRIARDNNVALGNIAGTGLGGRITKNDILGFVEKYGKGGAPAVAAAASAAVAITAPGPVLAATVPARPAAAASAPAHMPPPIPGELVPMTPMRKKIAERMVESKHTSAHVHTVFKVDMTRIVKIREREKAKFEQNHGVKLTYMPFIAKALMAGIKAMPIVNASVEGEGIRYHRNINIGIAVALDWGLIVPVVKQAEERSFLGLQRAINDLGERARNKKLVPDEVTGGTITITNPGIFGPQFGTPIILQPQLAILGMGGIFKEPVVVTDKDGNDSIQIRSIIRLTLGYDHRVVDGADADKFMVAVKNYLENWNEEIG